MSSSGLDDELELFLKQNLVRPLTLAKARKVCLDEDIDTVELLADLWDDNELKNIFTAAEMMDDFTAEYLKHAGFTVSEMKGAGFMARELRNAGFTLEELKAGGFIVLSVKLFAAMNALGATGPLPFCPRFTGCSSCWLRGTR